MLIKLAFETNGKSEQQRNELQPLGNSQSYRVPLSNTGPDPLENHKSTKPEFHAGPSSAKCHFCCQTDNGRILVAS